MKYPLILIAFLSVCAAVSVAVPQYRGSALSEGEILSGIVVVLVFLIAWDMKRRSRT